VEAGLSRGRPAFKLNRAFKRPCKNVVYQQILLDGSCQTTCSIPTPELTTSPGKRSDQNPAMHAASFLAPCMGIVLPHSFLFHKLFFRAHNPSYQICMQENTLKPGRPSLDWDYFFNREFVKNRIATPAVYQESSCRYFSMGSL
jgi:hypothetical protein